jgi:chromosome segregation ATPase
MLNSQHQKIDSKELDDLHNQIEDLQRQLKKAKKENGELADSRDMYKKELDNLTFEYDKLSREARNAKQDKAKLEKKLKSSVDEFILVQEEKAKIEEEKKLLQQEIYDVREETRAEISKLSELKMRAERNLLIQQQKTAQIFIDYEAHRKLIKVAGNTRTVYKIKLIRQPRLRFNLIMWKPSRTRTSTSKMKRRSTDRRSMR